MMLTVKKEALAKRRIEENLSQYMLSILSGLSPNAIYRMESEKHKVNSLRAQRVARVLECEITDIFTNEEIL